jgi:hypothetical protein
MAPRTETDILAVINRQKEDLRRKMTGILECWENNTYQIYFQVFKPTLSAKDRSTISE